MTTWIYVNSRAIFLMEGGTNQYLSKRSHNGLGKPITIPADWFTKRDDPPGTQVINANGSDPEPYSVKQNDILSQLTGGKPYLVVTPTGDIDGDGFKVCTINLIVDGALKDSVLSRSGIINVQSLPYVDPRKDYSGSGNPLPEAIYTIAEDYTLSANEPGVGYYKIALDYHPRTQPNNRSNLLFHSDENYPGSLGCQVTYKGQDTNGDGKSDIDTLKDWYNTYQLRGKLLFVWYGVGYLSRLGLTLEGILPKKA